MPPGGRNWKLINIDWYISGNRYLCQFLEAEKGLVNWSHNSAELEKNDFFNFKFTNLPNILFIK